MPLCVFKDDSNHDQVVNLDVACFTIRGIRLLAQCPMLLRASCMSSIVDIASADSDSTLVKDMLMQKMV